MIDHRPADSPASRRFGGVHGLQLGVAAIKAFQRSDPEELAVEAETEECDGRIEQRVHVQRMDVLRRAVRIGECEMTLEEYAHIFASRVVN